MTEQVQFRIIVGSYEHNLLCLSLILPTGQNTSEAVFQPIFHFQAHSLSIKAIDVAKRYLVTGSNDEHIKIYDLQKRKELGTLLEHNGTITVLRFSKENRGLEKEEEDSEKRVVHKDGKWLLSASEDGRIVIWGTKDWEKFGVLKGHTKRINDLSIHPTGRIAVSVSDDMTVRLWNLMTAKKASVLKLKGRDTLGQAGEFVRFSADGEHFVVGLLNKIFFYETRQAKILKTFNFTKSLMRMDLEVVNGIEYLITAHNDGTVQFFKFAIDDLKEEPDFKLQGHATRVKDFSIYHSGNNSYLVSVSSDGKIVVWDLQTKEQVAVYDSGERLNVCCVVEESVEKPETMRKLVEQADTNYSEHESDYESDGERLKEMMKSKKSKKSKKGKKKRDKQITVEIK
ncbi:unnamed protein product [Kuraishia capsulata CBS 1993]|uniref:Uncharacterized protein n=1 Tax=Kuraishia capsulata CBS 1993 TaxID=1382522 RepID=W6MNA4_9ASCO|nr:uncharacterized protein KUCA_T00004067001 [Kuraishia capsulata CBS 1993]CDK28086.1 unnamed protein product [Kuraishia capsulata CBS 1993]